MHCCLAIDEIFLRIICNLGSLNEAGVKRTLAALARACRTFQEASLDRLWSEQEGLEPLFKLFGHSRLWSNSRSCVKPKSLKNGVIEKKHWTRIDAYARRIQTLDVTPSDSSHDRLYSQLHELFGTRGDSGPLFPRLSVLGWNHDQKSLTAILNQSPQIQELSTEISGDPEIAVALPQCSQLRKLNVSLIESPASPLLFAISSLPHLESLLLQLPSGMQWEDERTLDTDRQPSWQGVDAFPALKSLALEAIPMGFAAVHRNVMQAASDILCRYPPKRLQSLEIWNIPAADSTEMLTLLEVASRKIHADCLERVDLVHRATFGLTTRFYLVDPLMPLLTFHRLRYLRVSFSDNFWVFRVTPEDMGRFAEAWPLLQTFHLADYPSDEFKFTGAGAAELLAPLFNRCPQLSSIHLSAPVQLSQRRVKRTTLQLELGRESGKLRFDSISLRRTRFDGLYEVAGSIAALVNRPLTVGFRRRGVIVEWWLFDVDSTDGGTHSELRPLERPDDWWIEPSDDE